MSRLAILPALVILAFSNTPCLAQSFPGLSSGYVPWPSRCHEARHMACEEAAGKLLQLWGFTHGLKVDPGFVAGVNGQYNILITCARGIRTTFIAVAGPDSGRTLALVNQFVATWQQGQTHCR